MSYVDWGFIQKYVVRVRPERVGPQYDKVHITCRCGNKIGGTIIRADRFSFTCMDCGCIWSGEVSYEIL